MQGYGGEIRAFGSSLTKGGGEQFAIAVRPPGPLAYAHLKLPPYWDSPAGRSAKNRRLLRAARIEIVRLSLPPIPQSLVKPSHARPKSRSNVFRYGLVRV